MMNIEKTIPGLLSALVLLGACGDDIFSDEDVSGDKQDEIVLVENEYFVEENSDSRIEIQRWFWSFGECLGPCLGDISVRPGADDSTIRLRVYEQISGDLLHSVGAEITYPLGIEAFQDAHVSLNAVAPLDEVYGCPDCNDGGAAGLDFTNNGVAKTTAYHYGSVDPELQVVDAFFKELREAMLTCVSTDLVQVSPACVPIDL